MPALLYKGFKIHEKMLMKGGEIFKFIQRISPRRAILPPEIEHLCNKNSNRKWADLKSFWGPNGTKTVILIYNTHIM